MNTEPTPITAPRSLVIDQHQASGTAEEGVILYADEAAAALDYWRAVAVKAGKYGLAGDLSALEKFTAQQAEEIESLRADLKRAESKLAAVRELLA
jgi:hypothetical protein